MNYLKNTILVSLILISISCKRDKDDPTDPIDINEEEVITSVVLHFKDTDNGNQFSVEWKDLDGPGGNAPVIDSIILDTNSIYEVSLQFLDESKNPITDITEEIKKENTEHLVCFEATNSLVAIQRTDSDGQFEIGLSSKWTSEKSGNGSVNIYLKHQPDVKDGTCTPGETDVEVAFLLIVE
jgi:hypothetical protein